jgi:hypothetical protein
MQWTTWWSAAVLAVCASGCSREKKHDEAPSALPPVTDIASAVATSAAATSHEGQRPPKPTPIASVTPPNLPTLKAQAARVEPPKSKATGDDYPCGAVWTGEEEVPLECVAAPSDERLGSPAVALIPYDMLRAPRAHGGSVLVVDPVTDTGLRRHRRRHGAVAACGAGHAPDSVDGACKPLCGDGGPRHAGYCGTTEDCGRGYVNVAGDCVLAAPKAAGTEPKSGIAFACTPSGCVYTIPKSVAGCAEARCQKSCPAPDFRLGSGKSGLLCLE